MQAVKSKRKYVWVLLASLIGLPALTAAQVIEALPEGGGATPMGICVDCPGGGGGGDDPPPELELLDADFLGQSVPATMTAGQSYPVTVTMQNIGYQIWSTSGGMQLGSINAVNNTTWGMSRVAMTGIATTGTTKVFSFTVQAPTTPGTYNFQWRMIQGATTWFGYPSTNVAVVVSAAGGGGGNSPPSVALTSPSAGANPSAPGSFTVTAGVSDSDGSVTKVRFYSNGNLIKTDLAAPFTYAYNNVAAGSYALTAIATDDDGANTTSAAVSVAVGGAAAPSVSLTRKYVYDANERLCKTINPESGATLVDYDAAGNILWTAEGTNLTTTVCNRTSVTTAQKTYRQYDTMNRLTAVITPDHSADITTTYYADGTVHTITAANGSGPPVVTTYDYNSRRLLVGEVSANDQKVFSLGYGYNANGHLAWLAYPDDLNGDQTVTFSPDALGRATQVASAVTGGQVYASGISYFPNGAIQGFTYGNGATHTMAQNARGLPERSQDAKGATKIIDDTYAFDANGNVTDITDQAQGGLTTRGMDYDELDRLTVALSPGQWNQALYTYDALDNLRTAYLGTRKYHYTYDTSNRLSAIKNPAGVLQFGMGYDVRGNMTSKGQRNYAFDMGNRLREVTGLQSYRYDGQGRRVQTIDSDTKQTYWIYSQSGQVLYTAEARRNQSLSYIYLGNTQIATRAKAWTTGVVTIKYQHTDALGSPVAETSATGTVVKRNAYSPFGEVLSSPGVDGTGYTGHVMDDATGLTYMQQRYYDPAIGRFLSVDPMASDTSTGWNFNRYNYAANNPYKFKDPDGRIIETVWDVANVVMDVASLGANVAAGNYAGAAVDAGGLLVDLAATFVPGVPGGAGTGIKAYRAAGAAREVIVAKRLIAANPTAKVQAQRLLRTADGKKAIDPVTGKGRIVDHAVIKDGKAATYETTSMGADKTAQMAKEQRILDNGGTFIRDKETRELVPVNGKSEIIREQ